MYDLGLTGEEIEKQEQILIDVIKELRGQGNSLYESLIQPRTFLYQLNLRAKLVKDENMTYVNDNKKELSLTINK